MTKFEVKFKALKSLQLLDSFIHSFADIGLHCLWKKLPFLKDMQLEAGCLYVSQTLQCAFAFA